MNTYLLTSLVAVSVASAAVPVALSDDGESAIERLVAQFEASVDQAVAEVRTIPLVPSQAYGSTTNGTITSVSVTVRAVGDVALDSLVLLQGPAPTAWGIDVLRDVDDSVARGRMNDGDLVQWTVHVALERGTTVGITLDLPGARAHTWALEAPRNLSPAWVDLELRVLH